MFTGMVEIGSERRAVSRPAAVGSALAVCASQRRLTRRRVIDFMRCGTMCCH
jgi:hypothetical protein